MKPTIREYVNNFLKHNKEYVTAYKGKTDSKEYASLAICLAESITRTYGNNPNFEIERQPGEKQNGRE